MPKIGRDRRRKKRGARKFQGRQTKDDYESNLKNNF